MEVLISDLWESGGRAGSDKKVIFPIFLIEEKIPHENLVKNLTQYFMGRA